MATEVLRVLDRTAEAGELEHVGRILRRGGLVAFPTETVYGIAVSAEIPESVKRLYELKQRPATKAMTVMVADVAPVRKRCPNLPPKAIELMRRFWPGPLTIVLPVEHPGGSLEHAEGMVGFRLPSHPLAQGLVKAARVPLLVPSANLSGQPPATTADEVLEQFPDALDVVIDGGRVTGGVSSTVAQVEGETVTVLREGAIPEWRINQPRWANVLFVCAGNTDRSPLAAAILRRALAARLGCSEAQLAERGFSVASAGMNESAKLGHRASRRTRHVARNAVSPPLDLGDHRAQPLTEKLVEWATRIFCMEKAQQEQILAFFPHRVRDVLLLDPEGQDIADPAGQSYATYHTLVRRLEAAATLIAGSLVS